MSEEDRQKLREHKKSRIRNMSQEELQQRLEQIIEQMKKIFDILKSLKGQPTAKEITSGFKSMTRRQQYSKNKKPHCPLSRQNFFS